MYTIKNIYINRKVLLIVLASNLGCFSLMAQNTADRALIRQETNTEALRIISNKAKDTYTTNLNNASRIKLETEITDSKNRTGYLSGFDSRGNPVYDYDDNYEVVRTLRVNKVWADESNILELDGSGILIGHWEAGGLALASHQELRNRIKKGESANVSSHATHTAGTMIGQGVVRSARGMANGAKIVSRKSDNNEAEIADFAIDGGILSNHSYSTGNPDGDTPLYGQYSENSSEWDEILYYAPYLMVCKSAGNNRNDGVNENDEGYDLIFTIAASKNVLTVGAVNDVLKYKGPESIEQSSFSSWGPTDDWRVKPDVVTSGMNVQSADNANNSSYTSKNGSSMSTAATTGSIALLQQHYHNLKGMYMKSATVKALLICTTEEAGSATGPDFQNGWGLLNIESAAEVISNNGEGSIIEELILSNGETYSKEVFVDGSTPITLTIAWTDPPGQAITGHDNQTPALMNDLDVRFKGNGTTFKPWYLSPNSTSNNFNNAAKKGDNFRDNVERIDVGLVSEDNYTITVTHKGVLMGDSQDFSLIIKGLKKNVVGLSKMHNNQISVYPIPSHNGLFSLELEGFLQSEKYSIQLFNAQGNLVRSQLQENLPKVLDYSSLNSELYYLKISTKKAVITKPLLIAM